VSTGSFNVPVLGAADMSASFTGEPLKIEEFTLFSIQAAWSGASVDGTLVLQASNDVGGYGDNTITGVVNWTDIPNTSQAITDASGTHLWNIIGAGWRWVRVKYARTAGTGTMSARAQAKPDLD